MAGKALAAAKKELGWGDGKTRIAEALAPHLKVVFEAKPEIVAAILCRFQIVQSDYDDPLDELRPLMLNKLVSEDACDDIIYWAHGWLKERIDRFIGACRPARLTYAEFHNALRNYVRVHDRDELRLIRLTRT